MGKGKDKKVKAPPVIEEPLEEEEDYLEEEEMSEDMEGMEGMEEEDLDDLEEGEEEEDYDGLEEGDEEEGDFGGLEDQMSEEEDEQDLQDIKDGFGFGPKVIDEDDDDLLAQEKDIMINAADEELAETDTQLLEMKINQILKILSNFTTLREEGKSRADYTGELMTHYCHLFGYNRDLMNLFMQLFSPHECKVFLDSMDEQRPVTIRTNTLKAKRKELAQSLMQRGITLEPVGDWSKVGIKINTAKVPVGATPEYLSGQYMLQASSSFLPVISLAPRPHERVLDMAAAPGGKTSYIAQLMKNQGVLVANDLKKERLRGLHFNMQRLGVSNVIVTNICGREMPKKLKGFDRVLLDAPCTGLGIISRDHSIKMSRDIMDVYKSGHLQRELLRAAIDCCKVGGYIVYSTCSIAVEENEAVVDYVLKKRYVKLQDCGLPIETEGLTKHGERRFDEKLKLTRRVYPHVQNMDGFFIAKLKKMKDGVKKDGLEELEANLQIHEVKLQKKKDREQKQKEKEAQEFEDKAKKAQEKAEGKPKSDKKTKKEKKNQKKKEKRILSKKLAGATNELEEDAKETVTQEKTEEAVQEKTKKSSKKAAKEVSKTDKKTEESTEDKKKQLLEKIKAAKLLKQKQANISKREPETVKESESTLVSKVSKKVKKTK